MEVDKLIDFLLQYQGQGLKLKEIKQWYRNGERNSITFDDKTELNIHKNPYDEKEISMWVESI